MRRTDDVIHVPLISTESEEETIRRKYEEYKRKAEKAGIALQEYLLIKILQGVKDLDFAISNIDFKLS